MSYQVLARKWRPHNFKQVVGQQHVLTALVNALDQGRLHHAYLFSGTRGVGKTTIARILAKSLNCEQGVSSEPCGQCANCLDIDQGRFVDLLEIDAASRTKVEDTRELLDNVQYKPAQGRYKVYLIDEVHMLSKHSFNALLKTLEEPPEYVKFLLATTDPQKLPITILSRCLQFHLKSLSREDIAEQLAFILGEEQAPFEQGALTALSKAADGSMRDALSLTDQALAFGAGNVMYAPVLSMLGTLDHKHIFQLLHFISVAKGQEAMEKLAELAMLAPDFDQLHSELAALLHKIAMTQVLPSSANSDTEKEEIQLFAEQISPEEVQLYYQIVLDGRKHLPLAPDGRVAMEMTVLRMLAFKPAPLVQLNDNLATPAQDNKPGLQREPVQRPETNKLQLPRVNEQPAQASQEIPAPLIDSRRQTNSLPEPETGDVTSASVRGPASQPIVEPQLAANMGSLAAPVTHVPAAPVSQPLTEPNPLAQERPANQPVAVQTHSADSALAKRNMLRSRKKQLESGEKKSSRELVKTAPAPEVVPMVNQPAESAPVREVPPQRNQQLSRDFPPLESYADVPYSDPSEDLPPPMGFTPPQASTASTTVLAEPAVKEAEQLQQPDKRRPGKGFSDNNQDPWCLQIAQMELGAIARQLALNSLMSQDGHLIRLLLKPEQKHLASDKTEQQLKQALHQLLGNNVEVEIRVGTDLSQETPLEIEHRLYQERLSQAKIDIKQDENVAFFVQRFAAEIDEQSIKPL